MVPTVVQEVELKCSLTGDKTTRLRDGESLTEAEGGSRAGVDLGWDLSASSRLLWGVCGQEGVGAERRNSSDGTLGVD